MLKFLFKVFSYFLQLFKTVNDLAIAKRRSANIGTKKRREKFYTIEHFYL